MRAIVATSIVSDGNMYNRNNLKDPAVIESRSKFLEKNTASIKNAVRLGVNYSRENFCEYIEVDTQDAGRGMTGSDAIIGDALITKDPRLALFLPVADCVGAVFYDPEHKVLAIAHLGRHSLEQNGGTKIVTHLADNYGSNPSTLKVWLTPAPSKDVYKIWALDNKGMKEATFEQLYIAGIASENINDNTAETDKDDNYYSYSEFLKGNKPHDGDHAIIALLK